MGTFEEDNSRFSRLDVKAIHDIYLDGDLTAEQALNAIAISAGLIKRTAKQEALSDLIFKVDRGELPASVLVAAIDEEGL